MSGRPAAARCTSRKLQLILTWAHGIPQWQSIMRPSVARVDRHWSRDTDITLASVWSETALLLRLSRWTTGRRLICMLINKIVLAHGRSSSVDPLPSLWVRAQVPKNRTWPCPTLIVQASDLREKRNITISYAQMHKQAETWGGGIDIIVSSPLQILGPGTSLPRDRRSWWVETCSKVAEHVSCDFWVTNPMAVLLRTG